MIIFPADHPLVLDGSHDTEGYTPKERRAQQRRLTQEQTDMAKRKTPSPMDRKLTSPNKSNGAVRQHMAAEAKRPRKQPLPGLEDARIGSLDDVCASIAEVRESMNGLRADEAEHLRSALKLMREHRKTTWRAAGVELARVPSEEKLRVRSTKEKATAEVDDDGLEVRHASGAEA